MNRIKEALPLSFGVFLCLIGSISIAEFLFHFDIFYLDIELVIQLAFYFILGLAGLITGIPLVVFGLHRYDERKLP